MPGLGGSGGGISGDLRVAMSEGFGGRGGGNSRGLGGKGGGSPSLTVSLLFLFEAEVEAILKGALGLAPIGVRAARAAVRSVVEVLTFDFCVDFNSNVESEGFRMRTGRGEDVDEDVDEGLVLERVDSIELA